GMTLQSLVERECAVGRARKKTRRTPTAPRPQEFSAMSWCVLQGNRQLAPLTSSDYPAGQAASAARTFEPAHCEVNCGGWLRRTKCALTARLGERRNLPCDCAIRGARGRGIGPQSSPEGLTAAAHDVEASGFGSAVYRARHALVGLALARHPLTAINATEHRAAGDPYHLEPRLHHANLTRSPGLSERNADAAGLPNLVRLTSW